MLGVLCVGWAPQMPRHASARICATTTDLQTPAHTRPIHRSAAVPSALPGSYPSRPSWCCLSHQAQLIHCSYSVWGLSRAWVSSGNTSRREGTPAGRGGAPGGGGGGPPLWPGGESQVRACDKQGGMAQARKLEGRGWNVEERCQQGPGAMGAMAPDLWSAAHPRSAGPHPQARAGPCSPAGTAWARAPARKEVCVCGGGGGGGKH